MNRKPVVGDIRPHMTRSFSPSNRMHRKYGEHMPATFDVLRLINPTAVASIRKAFLLSKTSKDSWRSYKREGRLDPRQVVRAGRGDVDLFRKRTGASTTKVRVTVLIDASGSMHSFGTGSVEVPGLPGKTFPTTAVEAAGVFGATIAKALGTVPTVDLDVFEHSSGGNRLYLRWRWTKGTPVAAFNNVDQGGDGGGNADGHALFAIAEKMRHELKRGERGVIMVVSDGLPSNYSYDGTSEAGQALIDAVAHARKLGITVIAVAIDGSDQSIYYGKDGMVPFKGSWTALGKALATKVGAALAVR